MRVFLVNDALILFRDMGGDAAANVAKKVNPDEEALAQIDKPAEDNTWHDVPSTGELKDKLKETVDKANPIKKEDAQAAAADAQNAGADAGASTLKSKINDDHKEKAKKALDQTKDYLSEKMPEERREQTIWRLKKMLVEIQGHPDCMDSPKDLNSGKFIRKLT